MFKKDNNSKIAKDDEIVVENGAENVIEKVVNDSDNSDITTDDLDDSVVAEENAADMVKKLREKLKIAQAEKQEYLTGWQRAKADYVNAKKRDEVDKQEFIKFSNERLIDGLIPVLESFDMAMGNKEVWEKVDKNWRVGVEYIASQLKKALGDVGLEEINPIGQPFDHNRDEAAEYVPVENESDNHKIIAVLQKGYTLNGRAMRPPKVKVGEWKKGE
jgi:molecular chaperone GrpE